MAGAQKRAYHSLEEGYLGRSVVCRELGKFVTLPVNLLQY